MEFLSPRELFLYSTPRIRLLISVHAFEVLFLLTGVISLFPHVSEKQSVDS